MGEIDNVFKLISEGIKADPSLVKKVNGIFQFTVDGQSWVVDLKTGGGSVTKGGANNAEVTITITEPDFHQLMKGTLNAQQAFLAGKIKLKGNMMLAMKLKTLVESLNKPQTGGTPTPPNTTTTVVKSGSPNVESVFSELQKHITADPSVVGRVNAIYKFVLGPNKVWVVDLKNAPGSIKKGEGTGDTTITISEQDFVDLMTGKLSGQNAFMQGKLKVQGNMANAMKLSQLTAQKPKL